MHGDRVAARIERRRPRYGGSRHGFSRTAQRGRAEGRIIRILDRTHSTVVGIFRYGASGNFVSPYETRLTQEIIIPPGEELTSALRDSLKTL